MNGVIQSRNYESHYVYEFRGYVYDPRAAPYAIPSGDYFKLLKIINPNGLVLEEEYEAFAERVAFRGVRLVA